MGGVNGLTRRGLLAGGSGLLVAGAAARLRSFLDVAGARAATDGDVRRFVSRPDLKPPAIRVLERASGTAPGLVFLAPSSGPGQRGALIVDGGGELVWFHPVVHKAVTDFKVALYRGKPVLTWWEGRVVEGLAVGEWVVVDASYRELARFPAARGRHGDLHEFVVTPDDTALVTSNETVTWDLRSVGGSERGKVVGGVVQELALPSGRLIREWRSLDHVAVDETEVKSRPGPRFDYFHINAIDVAPDGNLIVSARNTWAAYKVSRRTGRILWRLGGKRSDFTFGPGARFEWQHDAREHAHGLVTVFDNAAAPQEEPQSRAGARARREPDARVAETCLYASARPGAVPLPRQRAVARQRQRLRRVGRRSVRHRVRGERRDRVRRPPASRRPELPRVPLPVGWTSGGPAVARGSRTRAVRELERGD
jgi:hypothetical protein